MNFKKLLIIISTLIIVLSFQVNVFAFDAYDSYTYQLKGDKVEPVSSPTPFIIEKIIDNSYSDLGLISPEDIFERDGKYYIVDSGKNELIVVDSKFGLIKKINQFELNEKVEKFSKPQGVYVKPNGDIFLADTDNQRIVIFDKNYTFLKIIGAPKSDVLKADFKFYPRKLVVSEADRIFVVAREEFEGIMELNAEGKFIGFVGSNRVKVNLVEMFWKKILTKEQAAKLISFVPSEYSNISLDSEQFLYTVSSSLSESVKIKRMNPGGDDILARNALIGNNGDLDNKTIFVDIAYDDFGNYFALDSSKGRIFCYDKQGNLLYVFGRTGSQKGTFQSPSSIIYSHEKLLITDNATGKINIFSMTNYAMLINKAKREYEGGNDKESLETWKSLLKYNSEFSLAFIQMGKIYLRNGDNINAMQCFKAGNYRGSVGEVNGYNQAFEQSRKAFLNKNLWLIFTIILFIILIIFGKKSFTKMIRNLRNKK